MDVNDVPSFGGPGDAADGYVAGFGASAGGAEQMASAPAEEDELSFAASVDKVQEVTEQLAEFLVKFSDLEQRAILVPFLAGDAEPGSMDPTVEPHIDEARRFICHYLAIYSQCERDLILEKWRPAFDTRSLSSATESLTPSVTPPGSVTPTAVTPRAVTPREFLSARRGVNETYHHHGHSPITIDPQMLA